MLGHAGEADRPEEPGRAEAHLPAVDNCRNSWLMSCPGMVSSLLRIGKGVVAGKMRE